MVGGDAATVAAAAATLQSVLNIKVDLLRTPNAGMALGL
jgi:hypothetical protein